MKPKNLSSDQYEALVRWLQPHVPGATAVKIVGDLGRPPLLTWLRALYVALQELPPHEFKPCLLRGLYEIYLYLNANRSRLMLDYGLDWRIERIPEGLFERYWVLPRSRLEQFYGGAEPAASAYATGGRVEVAHQDAGAAARGQLFAEERE